MRYRDEVHAACTEFKVEENLVRGVIFAESKYKPDAVSRAGAVGLMQLMPSTAAWVAGQLGDVTLADNLGDPYANIRLGTAYLKYLLDKYPLADALAAYNAGEGNLLKWRAAGLSEYGFAETRTYVKRVLRAQKIYKNLRK